MEKTILPPGMLMRIIIAKRDMIAYYERLNTLTFDPLVNGMIEDIIRDERYHYMMFTALYGELFNSKPETEPAPPPEIPDFISGVKNAVIREIDTYTYCSKLYLGGNGEKAQDAFLRSLLDDNGHAARFNFIFSKQLEGR